MFKHNIILSRIMGIEAVRRQSIISLIWRIVLTVIGFFSTMYFARTVGASVLGAYFLFLAYFGIISLLSDGGFGGAAVKRISEGEEPDAYFSAYFILRSLFVTIVILILIRFQSYFVDLNREGIFVFLLLALIVSVFYGTIFSGIAGAGKMGVYSTGQFVNNTSKIFIQVIAVFLGFGTAGLAGGFIAGMIVAGLFELRFFNLHFVRFRWRHLKSLSTFSFWLFLTASGMQVYAYADTIIIGYYLNNADIGVYRIVLQFAGVAVIILSALRGTLYPKVSRWGIVKDFGRIENSLSRALTFSFIVAVPVFAGGILIGDKLLYFFYGPQFGEGYTTLIILLFVQLITILTSFFNMYLNALNRVKDSFKVTMAGVSVNIALNLILIPIFGIEGAAVATLLTMSLNAILARRILSQIIQVRFENDSVLNILKASLIMSVLVFSYRLFIPLSNVWVTLLPVILGGMLYGVLLLKFDARIHDELKQIALHMYLPWPDWL